MSELGKTSDDNDWAVWRNMFKRISACLICLASAWAFTTPCAHAATYYISPSGSDSAAGTQAAPFEDCLGVYGKLHAGDTVLIAAGTTVTGLFYVTVPNVTLGVYPAGGASATIDSGAKSAIFCQSVGGLTISNLNCVGTTGANSAGIYLYDTAPSQQSGITVSNVTATGYTYGLYACSTLATGGYSNVTVSGSRFFGNQLAGLVTYAPTPGANANWVVSDDVFSGNLGVAGTQNSGSGICLGQCANSFVEQCTAYGNGNPGNGGVGIWTYESNAVVIENCTSHDNHTGGGSDGDGFDLDGGCQNCVIEDCTSYDNDGDGYLICQYAGATPNTGNRILDNGSVGDGRKNGAAGVLVYSACSDETITGNSIIALPGSCVGGCIKALDWTGTGATISGNVLDTTDAPAVTAMNWPGLTAASNAVHGR
jgi:hypothetical protein